MEKFYVLTNIGLVYMETPNDKEVKLYPAIDFDAVAADYKIYSRENVIYLKASNQELDIALAADTENEF